MGSEGFVLVPMEIVHNFIQKTQPSKNEDDSVRNYHCLISPGPDSELFYSQEVPGIDISDYYRVI